MFVLLSTSFSKCYVVVFFIFLLSSILQYIVYIYTYIILTTVIAVQCVSNVNIPKWRCLAEMNCFCLFAYVSMCMPWSLLSRIFFFHSHRRVCSPPRIHCTQISSRMDDVEKERVTKYSYNSHAIELYMMRLFLTYFIIFYMCVHWLY